TLDAAFGRCEEHWDVQYLLRAPAPAAQLPLTASAESPEVLWVPWPLIDGGPRRSSAALPEGTVADMPGKLEELADYLTGIRGSSSSRLGPGPSCGSCPSSGSSMPWGRSAAQETPSRKPRARSAFG